MKDGNVENCSEMGNDLVNIEKGKQLMGMKSQKYHQHKYLEPLADYKDVVEDRKLFMDTLAELHAAMGTKFMIPVIGGRELDLHQLFVEVTSRGGLEKAISDKKWREIIATFNFPSTATNASFVLRKHYMSLLHHYENIYLFRSQGWNPPSPASSNKLSTPSVPSGRPAEPMLQQCSNEAGVTNASPGPSELLNRSVSGVIDGKFADGYFITIAVGTQKLKGVLYHVPELTRNHAADISRIADISNDRVYQERGSEDKERYRSEMAACKEGLNTGLILSDAVPIQQRHPVEPMGLTFECNLPEGDENGGSSFDDDSETDGMRSDDGSESSDIIADPSIEGEGFDLKVKNPNDHA